MTTITTAQAREIAHYMNTTVHDIRALAISRGVTIDDTARVQAMNAPDAVLKRVRLWAEHGLQSQLSDLVAAVAHIDAQADHITALTAERDALAGIVRGWHYLAVGPDEMGDYHTQKGLIKASEPYAHPALKTIAAGAHKETTDAG